MIFQGRSLRRTLHSSVVWNVPRRFRAYPRPRPPPRDRDAFSLLCLESIPGLRSRLQLPWCSGLDAVTVGLGVSRSGELALLTGSSHLHLGLTHDR